MTTTDQEQFERSLPVDRRKDRHGRYLSETTRIAYEGWCAAQRNQQRRKWTDYEKEQDVANRVRASDLRSL